MGDSLHWRVTFFYCFPIEVERYKSMRLLETLCANSALPHFIGDFNEILKADEQEGGDLQSEGQMVGCRNAVLSCQFLNLGYIGNKFTWATTRKQRET